MNDYFKKIVLPVDGLENIVIRKWIDDDIDVLPLIASNKKIWLNLRDLFPYPYPRAEGAKWVRSCKKQPVKTWCAIAHDNKLIGSIGIFPQDDIYRRSSELGYWLAQPYWGKGIMTCAIKGFGDYVFKTFKKTIRIYAGVFEHNLASQKVLEKAGYQYEGRLRNHITKAGKTFDELIYAKCRDD